MAPPEGNNLTARKGSCTPVAEEVRSEKLVIPKEFPNHPGGQSTLAFARESKRPDLLFLSYHLGFDLNGRIAKTAKSKKVTMPNTGPMYNEMHEAVIRIRKEHPEQYWIYVGWCLLTTVAMIVLFPMWIKYPNWFTTPTLAFLMVTYSFNIFHMRHHKGGNLYGIPWLNKLTEPFYDFMECCWAIKPQAWIDNHQASHHLYTNFVDDHDVENPFPFIRTHPEQPKKFYHKLQPLYTPFLFCANGLAFPMNNFFKYNGSLFHLISWFCCTFALPIYLHGWSALFHVGLMYGGSSVAMAYMFQVSHNHGDLGDRKDENIDTVDDWIRRQCAESISWGGYFAGLFFGGINYQVEHHICPAHDSTLYHFYRPELERIARKYGVNYTYEPTFAHAVFKYHQWLYLLS
mmetsp:Transcript_2335/g.6501  ORF Transcript_2335/g.6501 Transcript_2335/m.6501 type:complete len:402 (+) Transcript_2335:83-1288(+)